MRKKGLSLFLAVLMLLSMLAGFSLPAGAAVADLQAILEMHQEYDATLFEAEVQAQMLTFRAALEERIEAYLDEDIAGLLISLGEPGQIFPFLGGGEWFWKRTAGQTQGE